MARPLRNFVPDGIYHAMSRGVDGLVIFRDRADREKFLDLVRKEVVERGWSCLGYCLMDNHFHLLVRTPEADLAAGMQYIKGQYARYFNRRWGRTGHLFQGRYRHEAVVTDEHLFEVTRYIALNPVRAGLCDTAAAWRWSSHTAFVGEVTTPWLDAEDLHARFAARFGGDPTSPRSYAEYVAARERVRPPPRRKGGRGVSGSRAGMAAAAPTEGKRVERSRTKRRRRHGRRSR